MEAALHERPRPGAARLLNEKQASEVVAMVCALPPEGRTRWTVRLIAQEAVRRGVVEKVGRKTVRELLLRHDLKPWRENVVRARPGRPVHRAHGGRVGVVPAPQCPTAPVVRFDERPVQLREWERPASPPFPAERHAGTTPTFTVARPISSARWSPRRAGTS
ncbi:helix-turn-helix domain-containing protein [Pyxidicoccus sp. 3LG]